MPLPDMARFAAGAEVSNALGILDWDAVKPCLDAMEDHWNRKIDA